MKIQNFVSSLRSKEMQQASAPILLRMIEQKKGTGSPILCNLGCGARYHAAWINIDLHSHSESVFAWDLSKGLPVPDDTCDAVYSSHTIEHFNRDGAKKFLMECRRVLRPGGIIRLVAPDLECLARTYLACLDAAKRGEPDSEKRYDWIVIELLDQMVRHQRGGEMLKYWSQLDVPAEAFVAERVGVEYWGSRQYCRGRLPKELRHSAAEIGTFRLSGEVHQWMYDAYSLDRLLGTVGFVNVQTQNAKESGIANFEEYNLDSEPDGSTYKPDSFFIEACKS
jgi:predicted SAM-dependent methyltransferase